MSIETPPDRGPAVVAELVEEGLQRGGAAALPDPDYVARLVVGDARQLALAAPPRDVVHADRHQRLEPVGVELV